MATSQEEIDILFRMKADLADMQKMQREINKSRQSLNGLKNLLGRGLGLLGVTASVAGAIAVFKHLATNAMQVAKSVTTMSQTLDMNAEFLQAWTVEARDFNVSTEAALTALQRFTRRLGEAQKGTGVLLPELQRLGISLTDNEGRARRTEEVLRDYADSVRQARNVNEQLRLTVAAFDQDGGKLVSVLRQGAEGLDELTEKAKAANQIMGDETRLILNDLAKDAEGWKTAATNWAGDWSATFVAMARVSANPELEREVMRRYRELREMADEGGKTAKSISQVYREVFAESLTPEGQEGLGIGSADDFLAIAKLDAKIQALRETFNDLGLTEEQRLAKLDEQYESVMVSLQDQNLALERQKELEVEMWELAIERSRLVAKMNEDAADDGAWTRILEAMEEAGVSTDRLADNLTGIITRTKTWGDVGNAAATMLLNGLIKIGLQELQNIVMTGAAKDAEASKEMGRLAMQLPMKLMDALATSISSFGVAGILGLAAVVAAVAAIGGGFAEGGIVGGAPVYGRDNRLAAVASGEAIIPTGPTQRHRPLIEDLIAGRDPTPRLLASGGSSGGSGGGGSSGGVNYIEVSDRQALWNRLDALTGEVRVLKGRAGYRRG